MFGWRLQATALCALALALSLSSVSLAAPPPKQPFEFADASAMTLTPAQLGKPIRIEVLNNGTRLRFLKVTLGKLGLVASNGTPIATKQVLSVKSKRPQLPAAGAIKVALTSVPVQLKPGEYSAALVVSDAASDTVLRRQLTISVPGEDANLTPAPAVEKLTIHVTRSWPWGGELHVSGNALPLDLPAGTTTSTLAPSDGVPVGYVTGDGGLASITRSDQTQKLADGKGLAVLLDVEDLNGSGSYSGAIRLSDSPSASKVDIELDATDLVVWAALAVMLGIGLAFWVKRAVNVRHVESELGESLAKIGLDFNDAEAQFAHDAEAKPYAAYTIRTAFDKDAAAAETQLKKLGLVTLDGTQHDQATAKLGNLRDVADSWTDFEGDLVGLEEQVKKLPRNSDGEWPALREPASVLLVGHEFKTIGDYRDIREKVSRQSALLDSWIGMNDQLTNSRNLADRLEKTAKLNAAQKKEVRGARATLDGVEHQLWTITDLEGFEKFQTDQDLVNAEKRLASLTGLLGPTEGDDSAASVTPGGSFAAIANAAVARIGSTKPKTPDWGELARYYRQRRLWGDLVVLLVALAVATWTGLQALYFGHDFGGWTDYIGALLWGIGTETALSALVDAVTRLAGQDSPAKAAALPQLTER